MTYRDGQAPVVHLVTDLREVVEWADGVNRKWAFTDINAANRAADFYDDLGQLDQLNWDAIAARQWVSCRDYKMAEFLMHSGFPWRLVRGIGVYSEKIGARAMAAHLQDEHRRRQRQPIQNRLVMSMSSAFGSASVEATSGSSVMPQIEQFPGPI